MTGGFASVHDLAVAILVATRAAGRRLYARAFAGLENGWLPPNGPYFIAQFSTALHSES